MASKLRIKVNALEVAHLLALAFIAAMFAAANAHAAGSALCVVSNQRTGIGAGSLQEAVNAAAAGDTLLVRGICSGPSTIDKSLRVEGGTLDGGGLGSVITVAAGANVSIARLVITNGVGAFGGGINNSGTLTVDSTVITGNVATAGTGGGIFNTGTLTLSRSVVSGNRGGNGGGISVNFGGSATLNGSTVSGNSAFAGGGISSNNAADRIVLNDSTVRNNDATALGGGILVGQGAVLTAARSAVIGNHAPNGGGVLVIGGSIANLRNSVVSGNTGAAGAGIDLFAGSATLTDTAVTGNTATSNGGGVAISTGALTLVGSAVIAGNSATVSGGGIFNSAGTLVNCVRGINVVGNTPNDIAP